MILVRISKLWGIRRTSEYLVLGLLLLIYSCQPQPNTNDNWEAIFINSGSSSSPKATDLNGDGIKDVIIGAGGKEFTNSSNGILALNGTDGTILWTVETRNQIVGTPYLRDFNNDQVEDVLIGGRSAQLLLLNGIDGSKIWEFRADKLDQDLINDTTYLNFFNPQVSPDLDQDGQHDIIVSFGGYIKAQPEEIHRPKGYLLALSGQTGQEILRMPTPDYREIYCSPVLADLRDGNGLQLFFGTGGETIGGGFYTISIDAFVSSEFDKVVRLASDSIKGFIAPPVIVDVNNDGVDDLIINAVNGHVLCVNGTNKKILWRSNLGPGYEGYAMSCPGYYYGDDDILDLFSTYGYGPWPKTEFTRNFLLDGRDGSIQFVDSAGTFQYASPVTYDFTGDGKEDVLLAINEPINTTLPNTSIPTTFLGNSLSVYNLQEQSSFQLRPIKIGSNLGSTPLITDLDNDGYLDIISCYMTDPVDFYSFSKMLVERIELNIKVQQPFYWNSYMGPSTNSIYPDPPN